MHKLGQLLYELKDGGGFQCDPIAASFADVELEDAQAGDALLEVGLSLQVLVHVFERPTLSRGMVV